MPPRNVPLISLNLITFINLIFFCTADKRSDRLRALPRLFSSATTSSLVWIYMENRIIGKGLVYLSSRSACYLTATKITGVLTCNSALAGQVEEKGQLY